ncbi:MAG: 50S ribosomal protein L23 [Nitrospinaceae bacterium]|nr:50S ribosomal protein L23 [Nitrospinaceae bacterium]NIR57629.1 50S ribosomal protein L23 [Nitrospinaceae bacterium]NIS88103.1 50S ribosomal protein L23 [Nitrospinaceae bacterium]NIT84967.1 50S ribosomal protein L23 [Nitrospinaceae bacterium]NIU47139.1 50S ribosomal protein L23 [Nitrospinaceae bacterium]
MDRYQVIQKPLITEKSTELQQESNWVSFRVNPEANKIQIKDAVEKIFNVTVQQVNTVNVTGKRRRFGRAMGQTKNWKKAMVRLKEGDKIELFEGV